MVAEAPVECLQAEVTPGAKIVLVALWAHVGENRFVFPKLDRLAWLTGMKTDSIRKQLRELRTKGLITRRHKRGSNYGWELRGPCTSVESDESIQRAGGSPRPCALPSGCGGEA